MRLLAVALKDQMQAMRRRMRELHPDKTGREQTPEEREEITALAKALEAARIELTRSQRGEQTAKRIENPPGRRGPIANTAKRAAALAEKYQAARKRA